MKYFAILLVAVAGACAYFYFGSPDFLAPSPEAAALAAKAEELFPADRAAQKKWISAAKGVAAQIAALAPPAPSADFEKIKSRADERFDPASAEKFEYVRDQLASLAKIEAFAADDDVLDSEFALAKKTAAEKSPDDFAAQSKLVESYCAMFADARRAQADCPKLAKDVAYAEFIAKFPSNPSGAFARFKRICVARAAFENAHVPPFLDGIRERLSAVVSDPVARADELSAVVANPRRHLDSRLFAVARPDWRDLTRINETQRAVLENFLYTADFGGRTHAAFYCRIRGVDVFAVSGACFSRGEVKFSRGGETVSAKLLKVGKNLLFYAPISKPSGEPVAVFRLDYVPSSAFAVGGNAFGKMVSVRASPESIFDGKVYFYQSGFQDLLCDGAVLLSADSREVFALGIRGVYSMSNPDAPDAEDVSARARMSKTAIPTLAKAFASDFSAAKASAEPLLYCQLGAEFDRAMDYDAEKDAACGHCLAVFTRQNKVAFAVLSDNRMETFLSPDTERDFPKLYASAMRFKRAFGNVRNAAHLRSNARNFMQQVCADMASSLGDFRARKNFPFYEKAVQEQIEFRKKLVSALKTALESSPADSIVPRDVSVVSSR